jgi:uncharacterized protein YodC (DUF2158 family)
MSTQNTNPLKAGDTVRLKSGGPLMTISVIRGDTVFCVWFDGKKKNVESFRMESLVPDDGKVSF